ncbi:MAG: hypothetical protein AVDCRST_MAG07-1479, partial [uncultured Frankineae bacterium]
ARRACREPANGDEPDPDGADGNAPRPEPPPRRRRPPRRRPPRRRPPRLRRPARRPPPAARRPAHPGGRPGHRLPRRPGRGPVLAAARGVRRRRRLLRAQRLPDHHAAAARAPPDRLGRPAPLLHAAAVAPVPGARAGLCRHGGGHRLRPRCLRRHRRQPPGGAGRADVRHELVVRARAERRAVPARADLVAVGRGALLPAVAAAAAGAAAPRGRARLGRRGGRARERLARPAVAERRRPGPPLLPARLALRAAADRLRAGEPAAAQGRGRRPGPDEPRLLPRRGGHGAGCAGAGRAGRLAHRGVVLARRHAAARPRSRRDRRPPRAAPRRPPVDRAAVGSAARPGPVVLRHLPLAPAADASGRARAGRHPGRGHGRGADGRAGRCRVVPLRRAAAAAVVAPPPARVRAGTDGGRAAARAGALRRL